jgi:cytochrome bd-I ubiquinol oxidase subunit X
MWYFTWILGIGVALGFGIINVMWLEANGRFPDSHGEVPLPDHAGGAQPVDAQARDRHS